MEAQSLSGALVGSLRRSNPELEEVDRLIERRARDKTPRELANERAAIWKDSEATYKAENKEALYWQWATYYKRAARVHTAIAARLEAKATALLENGGVGS